MKVTKEVLAKMGIVPRLRLGEKLEKGGAKSTGPHKVKIISETLKNVKDKETGKPVQAIEYLLEESGVKKVWVQPLYKFDKVTKTNNPNYLLERLSELNEGEEFILEMKKSGMKNYINVQRLGNSTDVEYVDDDEDGLPEDEETIEAALAAEAEKTAGPWDGNKADK